jgi:uncharacterized protein YbjT (DUF2867 family)
MAKAIIAGASGLIGSELLKTVLQSPAYKEVTILVRSKIEISDPKLTQVVVNFDDPEGFAASITGHAIFCCLGSTRKKTPDINIYRKIDHDYPLNLAKIAVKNAVEQYHLVSAIGADPVSSNFYTKLKGETEKDIEKVGLKTLHIYRPSILTGDRKEKRPMERMTIVLMKFINLFLWDGLRKYRSIPATTVASAMYKQSLVHKEGSFIHPSDEIKELA